MLNVLKYSLVVTLWMALTVGCPPRQTVAAPSDPVGVLTAWRDALVGGRVEDAYSLLGADLRRRITLDAFRVLYARQRADLLDQAKSLLAQAETTPPSQRATVVIGQTTVRLVRDPSGWRLTRPVWRSDGEGRQK